MSKKHILFFTFILSAFLVFEVNSFFNKKKIIENLAVEKKLCIDSAKNNSVKKKYALEEIYEKCIFLIEKSQIKNAVLTYKKDAVQINLQSSLEKIIALLNDFENLDYVPKIKTFYLKNFSEANCSFLLECDAEKKEDLCNLNLQNIFPRTKSPEKSILKSEAKTKEIVKTEKQELCSVELVSKISMDQKKYFWVKNGDGTLLKICQEVFLLEDENCIQIISNNKKYKIKKR